MSRKVLIPGSTSPSLQGPPTKPQGAQFSADLILPVQGFPPLQGPPTKPQGARYSVVNPITGAGGFTVPTSTVVSPAAGGSSATGAQQPAPSSPSTSAPASVQGLAPGAPIAVVPSGTSPAIPGLTGQPIANNTPYVQYVPPTPPTLPTAGSFKERFAARLGYVPRSTILTQTDYTLALAAQIPQQQDAVASLQGAVGTLTAQQAALQSQLSQVNAQVGSLNSQISTVQGQIAAASASASSVSAEVATLQAQLSALQSTQSGLQGAIASAQAGISAYQASITGLAASPVATPGSSNVSQDSSDPTFSGFAPLGVNFISGYQGLSVAGGGTPLFNAAAARTRPRFSALGSLGSGAGSVRDQAFANFGYVPASQLSSEVGQASTLQTQLGALATQGNQLRSQATALNSSLPQLQGQVTAASAKVPPLQAQLSGLQGQLATLSSGASAEGPLQAAIASAQSSIASLTAQWTSVTNELTAWKAGGFPWSVVWSFGDGTTDSSNNPNPAHTYGAGSFIPSVTISVTTPDGTVHTHTFALPGLLVGQWPKAINIGAVNNNYFTVVVVDGAGMAIPNVHVSARLSETLDLVTHPTTTSSTGSTGSFGLQVPTLYPRGTWSVALRCLRNPSVTNTAS
jgi:predicted  nucleic acid-binding Zn-ribbon protein